MKIAFGDCKASMAWQTRDLDWPALLHILLLPHAEREAKDGWLYCPAALAGPYKRKQAVQEVWGLVIDLDKSTPAQIAQTLQDLDPWEFVAYTTHSHTLASPRLRIFLPYEVPISVRASERFGRSFTPSHADKSASEASRGHYLPSCQPGAPRHSWHNPGSFLTPTQTSQPPAPEPARPTASASTEILQDLAKSWKKKKGRIAQAAALKAICKGQAFARDGEKDAATYYILQGIIRDRPELTDESLWQAFQPSFHAMHVEAEYEPKFYEKCQRIRRQEQEDQIPATAAAAQPYAPDVKPPEESWIVRIDATNLYYVWTDKGYHGPHLTHDWQVDLPIYLAPAISAGLVALRTESGEWLSKNTVFSRYAAVADSIAITWVSEAGGVIDGCLVIPKARPRFTPIRHPSVEKFLKILAPIEEEHNNLLTWLSICPDLVETLPALCFVGPPGTGKTLLAQSLASIWSDQGPTPASQLFSRFNAALARQPLIFSDEGIPRNSMGRARSEEIREILTARIHTVEQKNQPTFTIRGAIRMVLAANAEDRIFFAEDHSLSDAIALAQRFTLINVPLDCAPYVQGLTDQERRDLVTHQVAEHVLWLAQNHVRPARSIRNHIEPTESVIGLFQTTGSVPGLAAAWILGWLAGTIKAPYGQEPFESWVKQDRVFISAADMRRTWPGAHVPRPMQVSHALTAFAPNRSYVVGPDGNPRNYRELERGRLAVWCDRNEVDATRLAAWVAIKEKLGG